MPDGPTRACLAIADISGYTGYLAGVELDHAQDILTDLLVTVVEAMVPFGLSKLEGDAAFMALEADELDGSRLQDTVDGTYIAFRRRLRDIQQASTCDCDACVRIPLLDLKVVVHAGAVGRQHVMGHDELVGPDVILVHRLLKNEVRERLGFGAYALYTQAAIQAAGIDAPAQGLMSHREQTDVAGEVDCWVADLDAVWQRQLSRPREEIEPRQVGHEWNIHSQAPVQLVWDVITAPQHRLEWDSTIDSIREESPTGRRGPETINHCMHGADAIVEEILDWRPPEYWLTRTRNGSGPDAARFLKAETLAPTPDGGTDWRIVIGSVDGRTPEDDAELLAFMRANLDGLVAKVLATIDRKHAELVAASSGVELPERPDRHLTEPIAG